MPEIIPIEKLKNITEVSELCHRVNEPVFIEKDGVSDLVIMSMETYETITVSLNIYQSLLRSEKDIEHGNVSYARDVISSLRKKYDIE